MQLTYLNRKSVLKYLEPNLRIHLSLQCPSLQVCDRTLPLHIRELCWSKKRLQINKTYYKTTIWKMTRSSRVRLFLGLKIGGRTERVVFNKSILKMMNYVLKKMLGGRQVIAKHICIGMDIGAFQNEKNLVTDNLEISTGDLGKTLESLTSIFHPSTFPLKSLRIFNAPNFKHPVIQTAQIVVVPTAEHMFPISNKRVHARCFNFEEAIHFIDDLLEYGKEVGTHFSVGSFRSEDGTNARYEGLLMFFGPKISRRSMEPPSVAMNIDNFSELAIDYEESQQGWRLNFKVQPREAFE